MDHLQIQYSMYKYQVTMVRSFKTATSYLLHLRLGDFNGVDLLCSLSFPHFHEPQAFDCSLAQTVARVCCFACCALGPDWFSFCWWNFQGGLVVPIRLPTCLALLSSAGGG